MIVFFECATPTRVTRRIVRGTIVKHIYGRRSKVQGDVKGSSRNNVNVARLFAVSMPERVFGRGAFSVKTVFPAPIYFKNNIIITGSSSPVVLPVPGNKPPVTGYAGLAVTHRSRARARARYQRQSQCSASVFRW